MSARPVIADVADFRHGRVPRTVRERQIVDLAEELFAERGYEAASMDELARRAGVSKPVVYDVVGSKEALFHRCFERAGEELATAVAEAMATHGDDVAALLRASAVAFLRFIDDHERAWAVLYALDSGGRTDSHVRAIRSRQARFAAAALAARVAPGVEVEPPRLDAVAYMLNGAYEALAHWRRENPGVTAEAAADWLVDFALPGLERLLGEAA